MNAAGIRIAVVQFPGTNCEFETLAAVRRAGMDAEIFRWNRDAESLRAFQGFIIAGGFSYEDRIRAGVIAAKQPIVRILAELAGEGFPILGICNGAQVLVEAGLVPGINPGHIEMGLAENDAGTYRGYFCHWIYVRCEPGVSSGAFNMEFAPGEIIPVPVAHAEGRFITTAPEILDTIHANNQIAFKYCSPSGVIDSSFAINPNGSMANIAGIYNPRKNVLAFMPHPERATWEHQLPPEIRRTSFAEIPPGLRIFTSMKKYILSERLHYV